MKREHTPGTWKANFSLQTGNYCIVNDYIPPIDICYSNRNDLHAKADAKLIAAAPDLLAACINLVKILNRHLSGGANAGFWKDDYNKKYNAERVIAKAQGGE